MGRIAAGLDFGQAVAQPVRLNEVAVPRAAFGVTGNLERIGADMVAEGEQQLRVQQAQDVQRARESVALRERTDAAVSQARLLTLRDRMADTLADVDRGVQDGSIQKEQAGVVWKERTKALLDDSLPEIPEVHREVARADLDGLAARLGSRVSDSVRRRDQTDTLASIDATLEHAQRLSLTDPVKARDLVEATLTISGPAAGLDSVKIGKVRQSWIEGAAYTRAYTAMNAAKGDNLALSEVERGLSENTEIDPQRKAGLLAQIEGFKASNEARVLRAAQHAEIVATRRQRESDSAYSVLSSWALAGKAANPDANASLIAKLTPEAAAAYKSLAAEVPARTAAAMLPISQQSAQLDSLYAQRAANGTSKVLEDEIKRREQVLQQSRDEYGKDPLRAAQERGILDTPLQPLNLSSIEAISAGIGERVVQAQTAATRAERPVSPLTNDEADKLGRVITQLPAAQRADRIQQISALLPPAQAQALAGQMVNGNTEEKRALGIAFALGAARTTSGRATSELALKGADALKAKTIKEQTSAVDGWRGQINAQLSEVYASPQQAEMVGEAARLILAGLVSEGASGSAGDAKQAVRLAVGGALREYNGARVVVPAGMELTDLRKRLESMTPADLSKQAPDGQVYVGGKPMAAADFLARLPDAQLQYIGGRRYVVKTGGTYAANSQRQPIVVEVGP